MDVRLRTYEARDFDFARRLYFETMRWAIDFSGINLYRTIDAAERYRERPHPVSSPAEKREIETRNSGGHENQSRTRTI